MSNSPNKKWISDKLGLLTEYADDLVNVNPEITNEYPPLTALKLIALSASVEVFSRIVPPRYEHNYYLDLFAGSGVTEVEGTNLAVVGSPILAPVMSHHNFEEYHFVDCDSKATSVLESRLDFMDTKIDFPRDRCTVHTADANNFVHEFFEDFEEEVGSYRGFNMFSFIDPEGMDPKWHVTRRIANVYGDLLIHYPQVTVNRDLETKKAASYFPTGVDPTHLRSESQRQKAYCEGLTSQDYTDITIPIRIDSGKSSGNFHYNLIYATRDTKNGAPYADAIQSTKRKIELLDGDDITHVIQSLQGDEVALDYFFNDEDGSGGEQADILGY